MFRLRRFGFYDDITGRPRDLRFAGASGVIDSNHWVTILIGKNGVGKSRILSTISSIFDSLGQKRAPRAYGRSQEGWIGWEKDGRSFDVQWPARGFGPPPSEIVPQRVIALATTPFDKFPRYRDDTGLMYRYLGLRNPRGVVSSGAAVFRALDRLFEAAQSGALKRSRTADIFRLLGYEANVEIEYRLSSRVHQAMLTQDPVDYIVGRNRSSTSRLRRALEEETVNVNHIESTLSAVYERASGSTFVLRADFTGESDDPQLFRDVQLLRRFDLVTVHGVAIAPINGESTIDLMEASSGELAMVTAFLGLASVIEDDSLIIIDEPEVSLHPEWQTKYIDLLMQTFAGYRGCHFIIATHSPLILSEIDPRMSEVISLEKHDVESGSAYAGKSSDYLLAKAFDVVGNDNLYVKKRLVEALRLAADGKYQASEFDLVVSELVHLTRQMSRGEPIKQVVDDLAAIDSPDVEVI